MSMLKLHCFLELIVQNIDFEFQLRPGVQRTYDHAKIEAWSCWNKSMTMLKHKHGHVKHSLLFRICSVKS
ncbi:hypothetical protein HanIR_Chr02g0059201 [Helianthus annuus]|nr:hypothetical protein HanIR_Chr02g0059201 [Helianthus annuus]